MLKTVVFQTIQFSISTFFVFTQLNVKLVLFLTIQFCIITQFSSIWPIDRTLSCATTPDQSGPKSDGNEGILHIPQSSSIIEASPSDCLASYPGVVLPHCRNAVSVFCSLIQLGNAILGTSGLGSSSIKVILTRFDI